MPETRNGAKPKVVITMPAYRAEQTLAKTVADIPSGVADQLILVDDASPDNTVELARSLGIDVYVHPKNRGYGGNQKTCYTTALKEDADIVVLLHPDYQYEPKAVPLLIAPILAGDADMTFGSRFAGLGDPLGGGMPMYRYLGNRITTTVENLFLGSRFSEMHSGLRAYTRRCLLSLPFLRYSDDFVFDSQFLLDAVTSGQRVVEVPIPTRYTKESSSISVLRSLRYVAKSAAYAAARSAGRGRRGKRWPPTYRAPRPGPSLGSGPPVERECTLCGGRDQELIYAANAPAEASVDEFRCTTSGLAEHDDILQCRSCGLVSARPVLAPEEILQNYGQAVDELYLSEEGARREMFDWVLDQIDGYVVPRRRLFEVGANVGLFLQVAGERGWRARGIEPSKWAVELGRERFGVDLRVGTVEEVEQEPDAADVVVLLDVLEHLVDPLDALTRLRAMVDDEGLLALTTVNVSGIHARIRDGKWPWFIRSHLYYFSPETLHHLLRKAGWEMVEWRLVPRSFHISYLMERAGESLGAMGSALEKLSKVVDPKIPVGWLGDGCFVVARPA